MREILFRGKRVDNGEWVEGYYSCRPFISGYEHVITNYRELKRHKGISSIEYQMNYNEVIPKTVGQYTGLCDKNGKKIFEGDILRERYGEHMHEDFCMEYVKSSAGFHAIYIPTRQIKFSFYYGAGEVIGNIHDNPELLKGGAE